MSTMSDDTVRDLRRRASDLVEAASPGPWRYVSGHLDDGAPVPLVVLPNETISPECPGDAAFIAGARTLVPELVAALDALTSERGPTQHGCTKCGHIHPRCDA